MVAKFIDRDRGWAAFKRVFSENKNGAAIRVGLQSEDEAQLQGRPNMATLGTIHEFGSSDGRIPARSFIRSTFDERLNQYTKLIQKAGKAISAGQIHPLAALGLIGEKFVGDIKAKIRDHIDPPLSDFTIAERTKKIEALAGRPNQSAATAAIEHLEDRGELPEDAITPLIDTGRMINAIRAVPETK
jgi:hypothetical protein